MKASGNALLTSLLLALVAGVSDSAVAERAQQLEGAFLVDVIPDPGRPTPAV
jgi:hypothetical protein